VLHLAEDGTILGQAELGLYLQAVDLLPDGTFWAFAAGKTDRSLVRLSASCGVVRRVSLPADYELVNLRVRPSDGSFYAIRKDPSGSFGEFHYHALRLSSGGALRWIGPEIHRGNLDVNYADGSVWVTDAGENWGVSFSRGSAVYHFAEDGQQLWRDDTFDGPIGPRVDQRDGTVWLLDYDNGQLVHLRAERPRFGDVPFDYWAHDAIDACAKAGIVGGYEGGNFRPGDAVTRDQMAVFISRALAGGDSLVPPGPASPTFPDVSKNHWAYRYVEYAAAAGVVAGYANGYRPLAVVDRGQMAVFVARAMAGSDASVPPGPDSAHFLDVPAEHWAFRYVEYIRSAGVVGGYSDGTYRPSAAVTRDQMAVYVQRGFDLPL